MRLRYGGAGILAGSDGERGSGVAGQGAARRRL